jgi:hypothetical protein
MRSLRLTRSGEPLSVLCLGAHRAVMDLGQFRDGVITRLRGSECRVPDGLAAAFHGRKLALQ